MAQYHAVNLLAPILRKELGSGRINPGGVRKVGICSLLLLNLCLLLLLPCAACYAAPATAPAISPAPPPSSTRWTPLSP